MAYLSTLRLATILACCALALRPAVAAERATTCRVQEGETVRDVAARVLGSPDLADELLQLNQLSDPTQVAPGLLLALPGPERDAALKQIAAAATAIQSAESRGAAQLCAAELDSARLALKGAEAARAAAAYSKASSLAAVAATRAQEAGDLAERRASVAEAARVAQAASLQRKAGTGDWMEVRTGELVQAGDQLRTAAGGAATLELADGSVVHLGAASAVTVRELQRDQRTSQRKQSLQLTAGDLTARAAPAAAGAGLEVRSAPAVLLAAGSAFELTRAPSGDSLVVCHTGAVQLAVGSRTASLPAGSGLRVSREGTLSAPQPRPAAPRLVELWASGLTTGVARVILTWQAVAGAESYHVQVARDAAFQQRVHEDAVSAQTLLTPDLAVGSYFWRVRARSRDGLVGDWSPTGSFQSIFDLRARVDGQGPSVERSGRRVYAPGVRVRPVPAQSATSIVRFETQAPDGSWKAHTGDTLLSAGGRHAVRYRGVAPDGRTGEPAEATLDIDDLPPGLRFQFSPPERVQSLVVVKVRVEAEDSSGLGGLEVRVQGRGSRYAEWAPYAQELILDQPGLFVVEARARDALGNTGTATAQYTVPR
jgi:ferric-dicitrate binding protein FerR (iron transport regulator)